MLGITFNKGREAPYNVLCVGAHSDDIEIGCGGTILKLIETFPNLRVQWAVFGADQPRRVAEAQASAAAFLQEARERTIVIKGFRDSYFPYIGVELKETFEALKEFSPDLVFTHCRHDLHQDHRLLSELTWNTFRNHLIFEYEIPKYDGDLGAPNLFVHLDEAICQRKIDYILKYFESQAHRQWFSADTFWSTLRIRGVESSSDSKYAEAFYCRKIVF
jgi:LmbE family N-acetylglucosaminyl deacetylase